MKRPVLITAGATRNPLDSMRVITANSSGKTGVSLAISLNALGFEVTVYGSPRALAILPSNLQSEEFGSTRNLESLMHNWVVQHPKGIIIHCAAVGDFEYRGQTNKKIPSGQSITIELHPAPKILDQLKEWSETSVIVSFKAAAPNTSNTHLLEIAQSQLERTGSDWVFANVLGRTERDVLIVESTNAVWFTKRQDGLQALIERLQQFSLSEQQH